jgi:TonB family protein
MTVQSYKPQIDLAAVETAAKQRWLIRMLVAAAAIGVFVLVLMYSSWFGNILPATSNEARVSPSETTAGKTPRQTGGPRARRISSKHRAAVVVPRASEEPLTVAPGITEAAIRSPLAVEVISGSGHHQVIGTRNDSIYLDSRGKTLAATDVVDANADDETSQIKASEPIRLSSGVVELAPPPVVEPLLAKPQTIEGAVVLLARVGKDGKIQSLQVVSGPQMLFAAALEAVKQWRFKPYYQSGEPVETETEMTVRFAISAH